METMIECNYVAAENIGEGDVLAMYAAGTTAIERQCKKITSGLFDAVIGVSLKDVSAGEVVTFSSLKTGRIVGVKVGGSCTLGGRLDITSVGVISTAGAAGSLKLPFIALEAGAAGDKIKCVIVAGDLPAIPVAAG